MKTYQTLFAACVALFFFGCGGTATPPSNAPTTAATNTAANSTTSQAAAISPSDTLKNFVEASKKKDVEAVKKTLSKGSLELVEKTAQTQNTTVDELLKRGDAEMMDELPQISNERIENDTASVDVKVKTSDSDTIPFVKEEGVWKIAFDKYQQTMMEKMRQEMSTSESNGAKPANKPAAAK